MTGLALALLLAGAGGAGAVPAADRQAPATSFAAGTERVQVEVVVRDRKSAILRGLGPADVEVYEDGVRQEVESLEFVERSPRVALSAAPDVTDATDATTGGPASPPLLVAIAFDHLSPAARTFAQQAALRYLDRSLPERAWMGVFSIDHALSTLQPFTADRDRLRAALDVAGDTAATPVPGARERDTIRSAYGGFATGFGQAHVAAAEFAGTPECRAAEDAVIRRFEILESRLMESFQSLERDQQGFATTHALLALIGGLQSLPGRKAILLFSEGLVLPADVEASFVSVISAANRANVTIYGADAGGLRAASAADETRRTIDSIQTRLRIQDDGAVNPLSRESPRDPTSGLTLLEKNEDALRYDPGSGLGRLADATGGFLIRDTNDLSPGLAEMADELGAYYVLSYTPSNKDYDGRFRAITVKVKRPHGRLQARKGYLAVKTATPVPVLDYEAAALARLESGPRGSRAADLAVRLRGLQFPLEPPASVVPIVAEVPAHGLRDLTLVVLVRDTTGQVVAKMSQRYPLAAARSRDEGRPLLFYREARLPAGSYELQAVAYDAPSGAAGTATAALEVPDSAPDRLRASSLMVVERAGDVAGGGAATTPLKYGDVFLFPNLGQAVRRTDRALTFFVTAWPAVERPDVDARLDVLHDGRTVSSTASTSLRPGPDGRIQLASTVPLERFAPGAYELRLTLSDGMDEQVRTAAVPIAP